jgi:hypothetical protein
MFRAIFYSCALVPLALSLLSGDWWRTSVSAGVCDDYCVIVKLEKEGSDKLSYEYHCSQVVDVELDEALPSCIVFEATSSASRLHISNRHLRGPPIRA